MNNVSTKKYAFVLGREQELCLAELKAVLFDFCFMYSIISVADNVAFINIEEAPISMVELQSRLGGTVKIFELFAPMADKIKTVLTDYISNHQKKSGKFNFALSSFTPKFDQRRLNSLGLEIKKELKGNLSSRFVQLREGKEVSTILTLKSKLVAEGFEFGLFNESIGILVAATNPEEWNERDYGKPAGDKFSGMLPPKLARAMINIALGAQANSKSEILNPKQIQNSNSENSKPVSDLEFSASCLESRPLVVDPFCGSGNIVLEALMLGYDVFASDNSVKAVEDTKKNVDWLRATVIPAKAGIQSNLANALDPSSQATGWDDEPVVKILQADATVLDFNQLFGPPAGGSDFDIRAYDSVVVVTEPYFGEPKKFKPSLSAAKGEYAKIKNLYLEFFKNIHSLSLCHSVPLSLCIVFPLVETVDGGRYSLYHESVDEIKKIGYTPLQPPLIYGRDYQVVKRQIAIFRI